MILLHQSHSFSAWMPRAAIILFCIPVNSSALSVGEWAVPEADARIPLTVKSGLYARLKIEPEIVLDFNALLGSRRILAAGSLAMREVPSGEAAVLETAQDAQMHYASGNPILRMRWTSGELGPFERRTWHLYFRTVKPGNKNAWTPLEQTFLPARPGVLLETSFEIADRAHPDRPEFMHPGGRDLKGETTKRIWSDEEAHSGKRSLKIARTCEKGAQRNTNRPFWWTWPPRMPVRPGQSIRVSAWLKTVRLRSGSAPLGYLEFRDAARRRLQQGRLKLLGSRIPHDWKQVSGSATAPLGSAWAVFWFSLYGEGEVYCDDVKVTAVPGGELPRLEVTPGPIEARAAPSSGRSERPEKKVLISTIAQEPPAIDGSLEDDCWKDAGRIDDFQVYSRIPGTSVRTTVLACADRDALYFAFECKEPDTTDLTAGAAERDGQLWEDDSVELFLDTNRDLHSYYQIIVNSRGVIFDQDKGAPGLAGPNWDGPITAAAKVLPDRWIAELKIEFTGLRLSDARDRAWGANFARSSFRGGRSLYVWSPVKKNFGEPQHFGLLVLPFDPTDRVVTGCPAAESRICWGRGSLGFQVTNRRNLPVAVRVTARTEDGGHSRQLGVAGVTVGAHSVADLAIPAHFRDAGEVRVVYELTEAETGKQLYRTSLTHTVPPPLATEPDTLVSYLEENAIGGTWTTGLSLGALGNARLEFAVLPEKGHVPIADSEILPKRVTGHYTIDLEGIPSGTYRLRARLRFATRIVSEAACTFNRIPGPFRLQP